MEEFTSWYLLLLSILLVAEPSLPQPPDRNASNATQCNIGGIFSDNTTASEFHDIVKDLTLERTAFHCGSHATMMNTNPLRAVFDLCQELIPHKVHAILMSHAESELPSSAAVSHACGTSGVPVIGISSRDAAFSDKKVFSSFFRTVPPDSFQSDAWVRLLCHLQYTRVVFIHSSDANGRAALGRFQAAAGAAMAVPESPCAARTGASPDDSGLQADAQVIFHDAALVMVEVEEVVWLVTEDALGAKNVPVGTLGLRLLGASDESSHLKDAVSVLVTALAESHQQPAVAVGTCGPRDSSTPDTPLLRWLMNVSIAGETGRVSFDENGDRKYADYDVVNVQGAPGVVRKVGQYYYSAENDRMELMIKEEEIIWSRHHRRKPLGISVADHIKVLTIEEVPFVNVRRIHLNCSVVSKESQDVEEEGGMRRGDGGPSPQETDCSDKEVPCSRSPLNGEKVQETHCCSGYCVDLLKQLSARLNFTYSLSLTPDGQYGSYVMKNTSEAGEKKQWTGMVGEIVAGRGDMIVAPLTINPERSEFLEFSQPFKHHGITILERKPSRSSTLVSFLQPFDNALWMLVLVSVHVVALVLCLLDRFSPFSRFKSVPPPQEPSAAGIATKRSSCTTVTANVTAFAEEDALNLSSAIWFAWGVLLNSGIGEGTPRSFSAKVLGIVWAAFAMMIVASYTANLAAFLVLERPYSKPTGLQDALLLNSFGNLSCATVRGSAVEMFFQRQLELSKLYEDMAALNYDAADQAIQDVKNGKLKAFIWDSSRLEYEATKDCELVTTGELFGKSGYGIGLPKDSPWTSAVTLAILEIHEDGIDGMASLDGMWFPHLTDEAAEILCDDIHPAEKTTRALGLKNMAGVFILVLAGIFGGVALIVIEIVYKRHHAKSQYRRELARYAFDKWRRVIVKRRYIRAAIAAHQKQKQMMSNGMAESALRSPPPQEFTFGTLIPSSVGNVGSVAAAAANVDLIQQMSPRVENIDSFDSFEDIEYGYSDISGSSE